MSDQCDSKSSEKSEDELKKAKSDGEESNEKRKLVTAAKLKIEKLKNVVPSAKQSLIKIKSVISSAILEDAKPADETKPELISENETASTHSAFINKCKKVAKVFKK
ncbi:unnamed protein product [Thelazia callipaeda]|uniref:Uncharacterized protein n=1 Tax=Thelazia callipaeda TaxID=103827 RepID=A0A0N5CTP6_THECL|nr:unnamed protein product [Thelazia callipaeda]